MTSHQKFDVRPILALDALTCLAAGALMLLGAGLLSPPLGLPALLLTVAGALLLPTAALFGWMSRQPVVPQPLLMLAVGGNLAWVAGSLAVIFVCAPSPVGVAFVAGQAAAVTLLAMLEVRGLGRSVASV
jgi:hypothetical protein